MDRSRDFETKPEVAGSTHRKLDTSEDLQDGKCQWGTSGGGVRKRDTGKEKRDSASTASFSESHPSSIGAKTIHTVGGAGTDRGDGGQEEATSGGQARAPDFKLIRYARIFPSALEALSVLGP